jgi:hypothetical protein
MARPVELDFPAWAAPLAPVIAAFITQGGGRYTVHCAPGGTQKLEVSFQLNAGDVDAMVRRLRVCNSAPRALDSAQL